MIDVAIDAAKQAGQLAYSYFKKTQKVRYKADNSPVTAADIEAEKLIRKIIAKNFPDHGIIGEELGPTNPRAKYQWVIDPIDGTRDFIRGIDAWGTFVSVTENRKSIIGIIYYPYINELCAAEKEKGAFINGQRTHVSKIDNLEFALVSHSAISHFDKIGKIKNLTTISRHTRSLRNFSALNWSLLLKHKIDAVISARGGIYDFAAPSILVEEAGGKFTDFNGEVSLTSGNAIATNGFLHDEILKILN